MSVDIVKISKRGAERSSGAMFDLMLHTSPPLKNKKQSLHSFECLLAAVGISSLPPQAFSAARRFETPKRIHLAMAGYFQVRLCL